MERKRSIEWIEALRTTLMLLIILTESTNKYFFYSNELPGIFFVCFRCFLYIGVPGFLIISGYLSGIGLDKNIDKKKFIIKKAKSLLIPFFVWNIIYIVYFKFKANIDIFSLYNLNFFLTGYIHLYFLFILFQLFVIYIVFKEIIRRHLTTFLLISFLISFGTYFFLDITVWIGFWNTQKVEWHFLRIFFPWIFFFMIGVYFGHSKVSLQKIKDKFFYTLFVLGIISFAIYVFEVVKSSEIYGSFPRQYFYIGGFFYQLLIALFFIILIEKIFSSNNNTKIKQYLINSGKDTLAIYLAQLLIRSLLTLAFLKYIYKIVPLYVILATVLTWIIIQMVIDIIRKSRISIVNQILFGGR